MAIKNTLKLVATVIAVVAYSLSFAQSGFDGNALAGYLGKAAESEELKDLKGKYNFEMANETHYLSKDGIELLLKNGALDQINLYKGSPVYGTYKRELPKGLHFGMGSADVKKLLGKPTVSYNSGYCEFEFGAYTLACWFEGGTLSQVGLQTKTP
jgi:hypothetical protein